MYTAQQWLEQSIVEDSQQAVVHQWLGRVYWHIGNPQKAQASFLMAAKLDPQESESFLYLGLYYWDHTSDKVKASKCLQRAYDLDVDSEAAGTALVDILK